MDPLIPRAEVFQLVLPNFSHSGRILTNQTAFSVLKDLSRLQTPDHRISYDCWLITAKEQLKWNDYTIQLFWDLLQASIRIKDESTLEWDREHELIDIETIVIFLILHVPEVNSRSNSPTVAYDTIWPSSINESSDPVASSPKSNSKSPQSPKSSYLSKQVWQL